MWDDELFCALTADRIASLAVNYSQILYDAATGHSGPSDRAQASDGRHGHEHSDVRWQCRTCSYSRTIYSHASICRSYTHRMDPEGPSPSGGVAPTASEPSGPVLPIMAPPSVMSGSDDDESDDEGGLPPPPPPPPASVTASRPPSGNIGLPFPPPPPPISPTVRANFAMVRLMQIGSGIH